jgi:capsular exopolysaccharide synthesis family protein
VTAACVGGLVAAAAAVGAWCLIPSGRHQARALVEFRPPPADLTPWPGPADDAEGFRRDQVVLVRTRDLIARTLAEPSVARLATVTAADDPVRMIEDALAADTPSPSTMSVTLTGGRPDDLRQILDALVDNYVRDAAAHERKTRDDAIRTAEAQLEHARADVRAKEEAVRLLAGANQTTGAEAARSRVAGLQAELSRLDAALNDSKAELVRLESQVNVLRVRIRQKQDAVGTAELAARVDADPRVAPLLARKAAQDDLLRRERQHVPLENPNPPTIVKLQAQVEELDAQIAAARQKVLAEVKAAVEAAAERALAAELRECEGKLAAARTRRDADQKSRDDVQKDLGAAAEGGVTVEAMREELRPRREAVARLESHLAALRLRRDAPPRVAPREGAVALTDRNLGPRALGSAAAGVVSLLGVLALVGHTGRRGRRIDDVGRVVTGLGMRVLGTVPAFPSRAGLKAAVAGGHADWRFALNESIHSARTMLLHAARRESMQVVMVTSATQGEGKTSLASQLAGSMATAGLRTLLVDCDLRNPSVHKLFDLGGSVGVCEVLCQEAEAGDAVRPTAVPNLWVIPAGQCSDRVTAALAQGRPLEALFDRLRGQFDFILVDSCPVLPVADALLVGQHVDGVVFSIMQDLSQLPEVLAASEKLSQLNVPLVGAVVNGVRQNVAAYGYRPVKQLPA